MSDADINNFGISTLEKFCEGLLPPSDAEGEAWEMESEELVDSPTPVSDVQQTTNRVDEGR